VNYVRYLVNGGGGIRTHDTVTRIPAFEADAFNRSATPPSRFNNSTAESQLFECDAAYRSRSKKSFNKHSHSSREIPE
jgi:hypothetical protein